MSVSSTLRWLYKEWPYAVLFTIPFLLLLFPFIYDGMGLPFTLIYMQLPLYMIHQVEEHYHDRFRIFVNAEMGHGKELFTPAGIFLVNSLGVWGVDILAIYVAWYGNLSWTLGAIYLPLINGISHVVMSIAKRCYNPGLITAVFLFIPLSIWSLIVVSKASHATAFDQWLGIGIGIFVHACIMAYMLMRRNKLRLEKTA